MTPRWQVCGPAELAWVEWGDEIAVYHHGNGDTHLLNPLAAELLKSLETSPCTTDFLVSHLSELLSPELQQPPEEAVGHVLRELNRLNIIEQVEP